MAGMVPDIPIRALALPALLLFAVSGHGVSDDCLQRQFLESKNFFALPLADKLRVRVRGAAVMICQAILHLSCTFAA